MANCDMCGAKIEKPFRVKVEEVIMNVCGNCSKYGTPLHNTTSTFAKNTRTERRKTMTPLHPDETKVVRADAPKLLKQTREQRQLTQEQLAQKVNIKESLYHKIESGHMALSIDMARKLQQLLNIKLIENIEHEESEELPVRQGEDTPMTMGDIIREKMNKKQ